MKKKMLTAALVICMMAGVFTSTGVLTGCDDGNGKNNDEINNPSNPTNHKPISGIFTSVPEM